MCKVIHKTVVSNTESFRLELSRHNYVTPTSFLELLNVFGKIFDLKKQEINLARTRTKTGLDKLLYSAGEVAKLQAELETMKPLLETAVREAAETMVKISEDTVVIFLISPLSLKKNEAIILISYIHL